MPARLCLLHAGLLSLAVRLSIDHAALCMLTQRMPGLHMSHLHVCQAPLSDALLLKTESTQTDKLFHASSISRIYINCYIASLGACPRAELTSKLFTLGDIPLHVHDPACA